MIEIVMGLLRILIIGLCVLIFDDWCEYVKSRNWFKIILGIIIMTYLIYLANETFLTR